MRFVISTLNIQIVFIFIGLKGNIGERMTKFKKWRQDNKYGLITFGLVAVTMAIMFLPFLVYNKGIFLFLGDYNVQQIPFYQLAHRAVWNGEVFWNWHTDLGVNFIGSYSFYLLFSPFFWITLLFPNGFLPYLMAPLLVLKTALASTGAYYYIKRFVIKEETAVLGGVLYGFSGFMMFNIFFNHFHDVVVFFPLLLIALEKLIVERKRGLFGIMVAVSAAVNYWFFIGEVVFVIMYVFIRMFSSDWKITVQKFMDIVIESVAGVLLAAVVLYPSVLAIMDNPRTGTDSLLTGWLMWIYGYNQRLPAIWSSFFFPPELPSQPNFFPDQGAKWSSMSAFLPLFSMVGVVAYLKAKKNDFVKTIIIFSAVIASVPVLNSLFVLFNSSYYARWFYMPILFCCLATAWAAEQALPEHLLSGFKWVGGITVAIALAVGLTPVEVDGAMTVGLHEYDIRFWLYVAYTLLSLLLCYLVFFYYKGKHSTTKVATALVLVLGCSFLWGYIGQGKGTKYADDWYINWALGGKENLNFEDDGFIRHDLYKAQDNLGMHWELPNIQAFHSIIPAPTMEFYHSIGIKRDVSSKPPIEYRYLRSLLSVKYLFVAVNETDYTPDPAQYGFYDAQNGYNIYQNLDYLPMGFGYDMVMTEDTADGFSDMIKADLMLHALLLEENDALKSSDIAVVAEELDASLTSDNNMQQELEQRREMAVDSFEVTKTGFTSTTSYDKGTVVFFSVPYDKGWTASVNGKEVEIMRANTGFMAIRVPEGEASIEFKYLAPGLVHGFYISILGFALLAVCVYMPKREGRKVSELSFDKSDDKTAETLKILSEQPIVIEEDKKDNENKKAKKSNVIDIKFKEEEDK